MNKIMNVWVACLVSVMTYGNETRVCDKRPGYAIITGDLRQNEIVKYDADGVAVWRYDLRAVDVWAMPDGKVLAAYLPSPLTQGKGGVRLISPDKETLFDYSADDEIMAVQPLENGNFLMAECYSGQVTEMTLKGERISSFKIKTKPNRHMTMRRVRLTPKGTVIVNECYSDKLREYDRSGSLLREVDMKRPTGTHPLPNGNLLISSWNAGSSRLLELDPEGNIVWTLKPHDLLDGMNVNRFAEATRLPNGNILTGASCGPWGDPKPGAMLFEVTPDKKIVWQMKDLKGDTWVTSIKPIPSWSPIP